MLGIMKNILRRKIKLGFGLVIFCILKQLYSYLIWLFCTLSPLDIQKIKDERVLEILRAQLCHSGSAFQGAVMAGGSLGPRLCGTPSVSQGLSSWPRQDQVRLEDSPSPGHWAPPWEEGHAKTGLRHQAMGGLILAGPMARLGRAADQPCCGHCSRDWWPQGLQWTPGPWAGLGELLEFQNGVLGFGSPREVRDSHTQQFPQGLGQYSLSLSSLCGKNTILQVILMLIFEIQYLCT